MDRTQGEQIHESHDWHHGCQTGHRRSVGLEQSQRISLTVKIIRLQQEKLHPEHNDAEVMESQGLSEDAIFLVWSRASLIQQRVDGLVILQDPAHFQGSIVPFLPHDLVDVADGQQGEPQLPIFLFDPEDQAPQSRDLPPVQDPFQQAQETDVPVESLEQRVDVGEYHADRRGVILIVNEERKVRIREGHYVLLNVTHLVIAERDEAPVVGP